MPSSRSMKTFAKAQVGSLAGGASDYVVMVGFTELIGMYYTMSIIMGGIVGAGINFSINRSWTFKLQGTTHTPLVSQLRKFLVVVGGSILLKAAGTYLITSIMKFDYRISRLVVELLVSWGFNFTLLKYWVFKHNPA